MVHHWWLSYSNGDFTKPLKRFYYVSPLCSLTNSKCVVKLWPQNYVWKIRSIPIWSWKDVKAAYCLEPKAVKHVYQVLCGNIPGSIFSIRTTTQSRHWRVHRIDSHLENKPKHLRLVYLWHVFFFFHFDLTCGKEKISKIRSLFTCPPAATTVPAVLICFLTNFVSLY